MDRNFINSIKLKLLDNQPVDSSSKRELLALIELLECNEPDVRKWAADELGNAKAIKNVVADKLVSAAEKESDIRTKVMAIKSLGELRVYRSLAFLTKCLSDKDPDVRGFSAVGLAMINARKSAKDISKALRRERFTRAKAHFLWALYKLGVSNSKKPLAELLRARSGITRGLAILYLRQIRSNVKE